MTDGPSGLSPGLISRAVASALAEDLGLAGDITTDAIIAPEQEGSAVIVAREDGVIAGMAFAEAAFLALDPNADMEATILDGGSVKAGDQLLRISGRIRALLTAERTALNFLGHMSGIATRTTAFVDAIRGAKARICCTRKTTPGLRAIEKYAVRVGGGLNHRFGLFDAVLIKDNHIAAAGGIDRAIERVRARAGHMVKIEVEVDTLEQLDRALLHPIDAVLLDNMDVRTLAEAVRRIDGRMLAEASGGVRLETVREIAETGVDLISVGALTHSVRTLDLALDWAPSPSRR